MGCQLFDTNRIKYLKTRMSPTFCFEINGFIFAEIGKVWHFGFDIPLDPGYPRAASGPSSVFRRS
jgi:hypothetical protein